MSRLVLDLSKAHHPDGIGTWQREVARALVDLGEAPLGAHLQPTDPTAVRAALGDAADAIEWLPSLDPTAGVLVTSAWTLPAGYRGASLFVVHDLTFLDLPHCHTLDNRLHCAEGFLRAALDPRSRLVAVSSATADAVRAWLGADVDVTVVPNGVSKHFQPAPGAADRIARRLGLRDSDRRDSDHHGYVLAVGSLEPRKNLERLLDAHRDLPGGLRRRFPLVVASGGGWRNERLVERLRTQENVHSVRGFDHDTLRDLYTAATVFAYPSLAEGFGLPVLEAMACGAPVVTSDRSSLPEVAGDAARLVDPTDTTAIRDALADLLTDPAHRRDLAARGSARAALFSWRRTAEGLLARAREVR